MQLPHPVVFVLRGLDDEKQEAPKRMLQLTNVNVIVM